MIIEFCDVKTDGTKINFWLPPVFVSYAADSFLY